MLIKLEQMDIAGMIVPPVLPRYSKTTPAVDGQHYFATYGYDGCESRGSYRAGREDKHNSDSCSNRSFYINTL